MKRIFLVSGFLAVFILGNVQVQSQSGVDRLDKKIDVKIGGIEKRSEERRAKILKKFDDFQNRILKIDKNFDMQLPVDADKALDVIKQKKSGKANVKALPAAYIAESYNLRALPSDSLKEYTVKVKRGTKVQIIFNKTVDPQKNNPTTSWCLVRVSSGAEGYIPMNLLLKTPPRRSSFDYSPEDVIFASYSPDDENYRDDMQGSIILAQYGSQDGDSVVVKASGTKMIVAVDSYLNIRSNPDKYSGKVGTVANGEVVFVIKYADEEENVDGYTGKWVNVNYQGNTGWVFSRFLRAPAENEIDDPAALKKGEKFYVKSDLLRLRDEPNDEGTVITSIPHQKRVKITDVVDDMQTIGKVESRWVQIEYEDYSGWVFGGFLSKNQNAVVDGDEIGQQFVYPVDGYRRLSSAFGYRANPFGTGKQQFHGGIDIPAPGGTPIQATADGEVMTASMSSGGYGNLTIIEHKNGHRSLYGHQSKIHVQVGQKVKAGQLIGLVGTTGSSTGNHLHFEIRMGDQQIDPMKYIHALISGAADKFIAGLTALFAALS